MNGNICPACGKLVMPYSRFIREAEPYKISACGSCGVKLKRSPRVYLYLAVMCILLACLSIPLLIGMLKAKLGFLIIWGVTILWLACWVIVINYLAWLFIGWVSAEQENK